MIENEEIRDEQICDVSIDSDEGGVAVQIDGIDDAPPMFSPEEACRLAGDLVLGADAARQAARDGYDGPAIVLEMRIGDEPERGEELEVAPLPPGSHDRVDCPCDHPPGEVGVCGGCNCADDDPSDPDSPSPDPSVVDPPSADREDPGREREGDASPSWSPEEAERLLADLPGDLEWDVESFEAGSREDSADYVDGWNDALEHARSLATQLRFALDHLRGRQGSTSTPLDTFLDSLEEGEGSADPPRVQISPETIALLLADEAPAPAASPIPAADPPAAPASPGPGDLTRREREVVSLLGRGLLNKEIADQLRLSEHTVKFHIRNAMDKIPSSTRTELVVEAVRRGAIQMPPPKSQTTTRKVAPRPSKSKSKPKRKSRIGKRK